MIRVSSPKLQGRFRRWRSLIGQKRGLAEGRIALKAEDFPPCLNEAIAAARMDARHDPLNAELDR